MLRTPRSSSRYNPSEQTSAIWTPAGIGRNATVTIQKTGEAYKHILKQYEEDLRELENLGPLLAGSGVEEPPAKKAKE